MQKLSVVISAYNEEAMLEDCLRSVKGTADEIIVVNNSSTDKTEQIAKKYTKKVFTRENNPVNLNINKNFGFSKATGDWLVSLDADERLTPELSAEIKKTISNSRSTINGYDIPRKNIIFGKWIQHSIWWPDYNLRLFRKGKGKFAQKHVHEKLDVIGEVDKLENPMIHYNYQTVSQFINKLNRTYTESEAENFMNAGKQIYWFDAIRWPANDFVKTFFFEKGFLDGMHGLVLSLFQAFYALVFFAKVWEKKEKFRDMTPDNFLVEVIVELQRAAKDIRYWIFESLMSQNPKRKIYYKVRRKLK
ncbi:MAG TPA: glycosyltransferase family 2 protein [Candidatus Saccharimonadales bacterium]|nr:glycosyltransferase family 2 protein [Candidatus Saccharimonadales bacterium]